MGPGLADPAGPAARLPLGRGLGAAPRRPQGRLAPRPRRRAPRARRRDPRPARSPRRARRGDPEPAGAGDFSAEDIKSAVDEVLAEVPGAENLSEEELRQIRAQVAAALAAEGAPAAQ
ncbi:hypothetical protein ACFQV2_28560 [Actinokineospora soli]|uniref:Uncharacterized protein n=1 Tax=Actinokineospora soli TaxID=1048753 RepID=A0ABW2TV54_9PSEU